MPGGGTGSVAPVLGLGVGLGFFLALDSGCGFVVALATAGPALLPDLAPGEPGDLSLLTDAERAVIAQADARAAGLRTRALRLSAPPGTEVELTKDASAADTEHKTAESAAVTAAGTIAVGDTVYFNLARKVGNAADDLDLEARLHGLRLYFVTNKATDD